MNLDVGSGAGPYHWNPRAEICVSLDIPRLRGKEDIIRADAHFLPFRESQFQMVFAYNLLEHVKNPWKVLAELKRVSRIVKLRQDTIFNIASYATPEHLWFQLPNLKFLPYPRTRLGKFASKMLRVLVMQSIPRLRRQHQLKRVMNRFLPPNQQYDVILE